MKLINLSKLFLLTAVLGFFTANIYAQEPISSEGSSEGVEVETERSERLDYKKSLLLDAFVYEDVRFYALRYNLELLRGENVSFSGSIGLGMIDPSSPIFNEQNLTSSELDIVIPLEASLLIGKRKHFLELGLGTHLLFGLEKTEESLMTEAPSGIQVSRYQGENESTSLWVFSNIAYRYQPKADGGMFFRTGVMPTIQPYTMQKETNFNVGFNIGVGYTF